MTPRELAIAGLATIGPTDPPFVRGILRQLEDYYRHVLVPDLFDAWQVTGGSSSRTGFTSEQIMRWAEAHQQYDSAYHALAQVGQMINDLDRMISVAREHAEVLDRSKS